MSNEHDTPPANSAAASDRLVSSDLLALIAFLASYQEQLNVLRRTLMSMPDAEQIKEALIMQWPVIQGTRNQITLAEIGRMKHTPEEISRAVTWIKANTV